MATHGHVSRRDLLKTSLGTLGVLATSSAYGEALRSMCRLIPRQTKGPFYPVEDQIDTDNDLTSVRGKSDKAQGQVIYVQGDVLDERCQPISDVLVEIWQASASGRYNHPNDANPAPRDPNFQGWGRTRTAEDGRYLFKTILPGPYPAAVGWMRPPHIHFRIVRRGFQELITQMYFAGSLYNERDRLLNTVPEAERATLVVMLEEPSSAFEPTSKVSHFNLTLRRR